LEVVGIVNVTQPMELVGLGSIIVTGSCQSSEFNTLEVIGTVSVN
jgi:hypothetical protein